MVVTMLIACFSWLKIDQQLTVIAKHIITTMVNQLWIIAVISMIYNCV